MSLLLKTEPTQCHGSTGGIRKLLIANSTPVISALFTGDNLNLVTGLEFKPGEEAFFIQFDTNKSETTLTDTLNKRNGDLYDIEIKTNLVRIDEVKRGFLNELKANPLIVVTQDGNGKFWIVGIDAPLRLTSYEGQTDSAGGVSQYSFTIAGKGCSKMLELSEAAANDLNVLVTDCSAFAASQVQAIPGVLSQYFDCFVQDFF